MRLFVALVPPPDVLDELAEAVRPHRDAVPDRPKHHRSVWS